jgi:hypothetical protein
VRFFVYKKRGKYTSIILYNNSSLMFIYSTEV